METDDAGQEEMKVLTEYFPPDLVFIERDHCQADR